MSHQQSATIINGVPDEYGGKDDRNFLVKAKDAVVHAVKGDPTPGEKVEVYAQKQKDLAADCDKHDKIIHKEEEKAAKLTHEQMKAAEKAAAADAELQKERMKNLDRAAAEQEKLRDEQRKIAEKAAAADANLQKKRMEHANEAAAEQSKLYEEQMKHVSKASATEAEKLAKMRELQGYAARVEDQAEGVKADTLAGGCTRAQTTCTQQVVIEKRLQ